MTELIDNPPPLPEPFGYCREWQGDDSDLNNWLFETDRCELDEETWCSLFTDDQYRAGEAAAFARGVAARQPEIDALRARIRAMEEQEPVAWAMLNKDGEVYDCIGLEEHDSHEGSYTTPLYTAPGAKR